MFAVLSREERIGRGGDKERTISRRTMDDNDVIPIRVRFRRGRRRDAAPANSMTPEMGVAPLPTHGKGKE